MTDAEKIDLLKLASSVGIKEAARLLSEPARLAEHHFTEPQPIRCKWCGSTEIMKYGFRDGIQEYICLKCKRKFIAKDAPYKMRSTVEEIGSAINMFYDGMSFADIARHMDETYHNPVNRSTVWRWVIRFTIKALNLVEQLTPRVSGTWVVDETVIKVGGANWWFWDIIDEDTRFLLASHLSRTRGIPDVMIVMENARDRVRITPDVIISDGLGVYPDGIERVFGADAKHIKAKGLTETINTNLIERFHSTLKERTKVLRGFKNIDTADLILNGFLVHYNFFRPHMTLKNRTPAEVAKIKLPAKNWTELVRVTGEIANYD
jgi:putative transposase